MEMEDKVEELIDLWPKKRDRDSKIIEKRYLSEVILSEEVFQAVKNAMEIKIEDTNPAKLPALIAFVKSCLVVPTTPEKTIQEKSSQEPAAIKVQDNKDAERLFLTIWDMWPRNPDFLERRQPALDAFISAARVFPLATLQTACITYADSFNDGSNSTVYAKTLKNFILDKELVEHWVSICSNKENNKGDREAFESAYSWYPDFSNKKTDKIREISWVNYWRNLKREDRLDFNAACRCYRQKRRSAWRAECGEVSLETIAMYTKGFSAFVIEWKDAINTGLYTKNEIVETKCDMFGDFLVQELKENDLDVLNIWGWSDGPFFSTMALKYMFSKGFSVKDAVYEVLKQAPSVVEEKLNGNDYILKIKDPVLAKEQMIGYNAESLAAKMYQRLLEVKLIEMPVELS